MPFQWRMQDFLKGGYVTVLHAKCVQIFLKPCPFSIVLERNSLVPRLSWEGKKSLIFRLLASHLYSTELDIALVSSLALGTKTNVPRVLHYSVSLLISTQCNCI